MSDPAPFPIEGRLLGLDFGTVRIGIAVSTPEQSIASPLDNYTRRSEKLDTAYYQSLVKENRIVGLVVGLPMHVNGDEGESAYLAREFGTWIASITLLPVTYWDERYTSSVAADLMRDAGVARSKRKQRLDKIAAQILLQSYLDEMLRRRRPPPEPVEEFEEYHE